MFKIMFSKPSATFKMSGTAAVAVSFSVPQRGDILILLHWPRWSEGHTHTHAHAHPSFFSIHVLYSFLNYFLVFETKAIKMLEINIM